MTKAPYSAGQNLFCHLPFSRLFTGKGLLPMQLGMEKAGGKGRYGREQVKWTSPRYFRACFTVYFTPVVKGTLGKHKR